MAGLQLGGEKRFAVDIAAGVALWSMFALCPGHGLDSVAFLFTAIVWAMLALRRHPRFGRRDLLRA